MIEVFIRGIRIEADGIRSFELAPVSGILPDASAGAHIQVEVSPGIRRAYSLCQHPEDRGCYRIAVKLEEPSRGGSAAMHRFGLGQILKIEDPRNLFELDPVAHHHILLAGGIGITPLYAMYQALGLAGKSRSLHQFARSPAHAAFADRTHAAAQHYFSLDAEATARQLREIIRPHAADHHATFYTCGPAAFMDAVSLALSEAKVDPARLRSERFGPIALPAPTHNPAGGFRIHFARSGIEVEVPNGTPIIEIARRHQIEIPSSCEMGVCGACLSDVLAGEPEHLDQYLSAEERAANTCILPCVSRSLSPLLIIDR
jgi:vanillate O-demethylase ferredoxin subunit